MTDTITLRRAAEQALESLEGELTGWRTPAQERAITALRAALDAALAEPDAKPKPVAWWHPARGFSWAASDVEVPPTTLPLYAAPPDATHPGYIIGSHFLETAYSRIAAGEAEDAVLAEVLGERGWAKREPPAKPEPATETQVTKAYVAEGTKDWWSDWKAGWRAAERHHKIITMEDGK